MWLYIHVDYVYKSIHEELFIVCITNNYVVVKGRKRTLVHVGEVIEIHTAITKDCQ